jgi:sialate O-acetylesterase
MKLPGNKLFFICIGLLLLAACKKTQAPQPDVESLPTVPEVPVTVTPASVSFSVSNVLQSNMVIQRDKPFTVWGKAAAGSKVNVSTSWAGDFSAVADYPGTWKVTIPAAAANSTPQTVTISTDGYDAVALKNILIGDVWLCAGQSNMNMPMDAIAPFKGVVNYQAEINAANYPNIRALTVIQDNKPLPVTEFSTPANWVACTPQTTGAISAVAFYFAQKLHTTLNVPVGIVVSSVNGSWCASWMNGEAFNLHPDLKNYVNVSGGSLYNGMINPLAGLAIKGCIWYQGENDQTLFPVGDYTKLNSALIEGWRYKFNDTALPFYLVQLTPFADDYDYTVPVGGDQTYNWLAYFREAQANVLTVPNTGMAVTMDVGEANNHHPGNKKPVGERLALLALKNTYGQNVICNGPKYSDFIIGGNTAIINFTNGTATGLTTQNNAPLNQLFFLAGPDRIFKQGIAQVTGTTITIKAPNDLVLPIMAVRYAFTNVAITNLQNGAGLPAEPFRTDNWNN